eukprot:765341-Hanusia_phi.AAC.1
MAMRVVPDVPNAVYLRAPPSSSQSSSNTVRPSLPPPAVPREKQLDAIRASIRLVLDRSTVITALGEEMHLTIFSVVLASKELEISFWIHHGMLSRPGQPGVMPLSLRKTKEATLHCLVSVRRKWTSQCAASGLRGAEPRQDCKKTEEHKSPLSPLSSTRTIRSDPAAGLPASDPAAVR